MQFYDRNESALESEKDKLEKQAAEWGNNAPMLYLLSGTTMVRVLPPYSTAGVFFREVTRHRLRIHNRTEIFLCPAATSSLPCPVCLMGQEYTESHDEAKMKFAREFLRPRTAYLYNVICYSGPQNPKNGSMPEFGKVYVMEAGVQTHRQIISLDQDPATGWADITNPQKGVNLIIKRTGQGLDTKYEVNPHGGGRSDVFTDLQARGIDVNSLALINLDEVGAVPDSAKLQEIMAGLGQPITPSTTPTPIPVVSPNTPAPVEAPVAQPATPASSSGWRTAPMPTPLPLQPPAQTATPVQAPPIPPPPGQGQ